MRNKIHKKYSFIANVILIIIILIFIFSISVYELPMFEKNVLIISIAFLIFLQIYNIYKNRIKIKTKAHHIKNNVKSKFKLKSKKTMIDKELNDDWDESPKIIYE